MEPLKTTVRTDDQGRIIVEPFKPTKKIKFQVTTIEGHTATAFLTADQCGAIIFAMEMALEAIELQAFPTLVV